MQEKLTFNVSNMYECKYNMKNQGSCEVKEMKWMEYGILAIATCNTYYVQYVEYTEMLVHNIVTQVAKPT